MFKKILSDSVIYGFSRILMMAVAMFLVPIYSKMFSKSDYGTMETFNSLINIVTTFLTAGILNSIYRFVYEKSELEKIKYYSTIYIYLLFLSIILVALAYLERYSMSRFLIRDDNHTLLSILSISLGCSAALLTLNLDICRSQFKKVNYLILSAGSALTLALLGVIFVYKYKMGILGFFYASIIAQVSFLIIGTILNAKSLGFYFSKKMLLQILGFSVPFIPAAFGGTLNKYVDRYVLLYTNSGSIMESLDNLGLYSMSLRISSIFELVGLAFSTAWYPYAMKIINQEDAKSIYSNMLDNMIILFVLAAGLFSSAQIFILHTFVDHKFIDAYKYVYLMIDASVIGYSSYALNLGIVITKKTKVISIPTLVSGFVNLFLSIILVKQYGIMGINIAMLLSQVIYTGLGYYYGNKFYPIKFHFPRNFISLGILGGWQFMIYFVDLSYTDKILMNGLLKALLAILFVGSMYYFNKDFRDKSTNTVKAIYKKYFLKGEITTAV